jgi:RNA polymerase sigma-70 factor (ECF subfamily)
VTSEPQQSFTLAIAKSHGVKLRRFLSARMRNAAADAQDLMQEIYLRLLRIKDYEAIRNPEAYLYTIASHVLHQHALKTRAQPESRDPLDLVAYLESTSTDDTDPADELHAKRRLERICKDLEAISPRACATLLMYRCEGLTLEEIGTRLGVSRPMVKKYLLKALAYCDQHLENAE